MNTEGAERDLEGGIARVNEGGWGGLTRDGAR